MNADPGASQAQLSERIKPVLEAAMLAVAGDRPAHEIAGIGISTDADAGAVVAFANTREHLDEMVAEEPEFALDSKWHLGEWDLDVVRAGVPDPLAAVRDELAQRKAAVVTATAEGAASGGRAVPGMQEHRLAVWNAIADAMAKSAEEGFFDRWPDAARVFMPLDADVDEQQLAAWSAPLNDDAAVAELRSFLQLD